MQKSSKVLRFILVTCLLKEVGLSIFFKNTTFTQMLVEHVVYRKKDIIYDSRN